MPSFISCGLAVIELSIGASAIHREYCLERMEAYHRPDRQVAALIDTGADATVVDLGILEDLCLTSYDVRRVEDFNGGSQEYPVYLVLLKVRTKSGEVIFEDANFEVVEAPLQNGAIRPFSEWMFFTHSHSSFTAKRVSLRSRPRRV